MDEFIISIFCEVDNFCKKLDYYLECHNFLYNRETASIELPSALTLSEAMSIGILFHLIGYQTFQWYYKRFLSNGYQTFFPHLPSYGRFVELMPLPFLFFCLTAGNMDDRNPTVMGI